MKSSGIAVDEQFVTRLDMGTNETFQRLVTSFTNAVLGTRV